MNEHLSSRLKGIQAILMAHHAAGAMLPSASKGSERETLIREFLRRLFPPPFRFGTGAITDASDGFSGQLDIVVEWPFLMSFPTVGANDRLYLAESVAFCIEVKSSLDSQWDQVKSSAEKVKPLRRKWTGHLHFEQAGGLEVVDASISRIPFLAVGYQGHKSADSLADLVNGTAEINRPDAALVLDSGAYVGPSGRYVGADGLFAFCMDISYFARNVIVAEPLLVTYINKPSATQYSSGIGNQSIR